jgi:hypothetical protein
MKPTEAKPYSQKVVSMILNEVNDYETTTIDLSDKVTFSQYDTIQTIITHQNHGFLTELAAGQKGDREFYDIITPMIETAVSNIDLDTDNIETYTDNPDYQAQELLSKAAIKRYNRQTNQGVNLNEMVYQFADEGNIIARKVEGGEIYRPVLPQNLIIVDPSARTLEDTAVIERCPMGQTEVRGTKGWDNIDELFEYCDLTETDSNPYYEIFYRYGEITKKRLGNLKKEVHGIKYRYQEGDKNNYVQALVVIARAKKGVKNDQSEKVPGFVLFVEELKPQTINVTKKLKVKRYKPYESVRLGKYNGRFWGAGYREIGIPYQNRANELGNQLRGIMQLASKMVFWSSDKEIAGKNILSAIKNGQIIQAENLYLLNNVFPNLSLYAEEWNRNITEAQKALKAFEAASGESLPSSTSATAVAVQNNAIGKFFDFKREKFGLFLSVIYKRWVIPALLKDLSADEAIELTGDSQFIDEVLTAHVRGLVIKNEMLNIALSGGTMYKEMFDMLVQQKKEELMKNPKQFVTIYKDFFKGIDIYVGINVTGEGFNKQARLSNILNLIKLSNNPDDMQDDLNEVRQMLGLKVRNNKPVQQTQQVQANSLNTQNLPMKEQPMNPQKELGIVNTNML